MNSNYTDEPMIQVYIFETSQILEDLEQLMLRFEQELHFDQASINQIFRYMHTLKGSSSMMMFNEISDLSHLLEDVFYLIREHVDIRYDKQSLTDLVLESLDFFKVELLKISCGEDLDGDAKSIMEALKLYILDLKDKNNLSQPKKKESEEKYYISKEETGAGDYYKALIFFDDGCEMENVRAYTVIQQLMESAHLVYYFPNDILDNDESVEVVKNQGFSIAIKTNDTYETLKERLEETIFLKSLELEEISLETFEKLAMIYQVEEDFKPKMPKVLEEADGDQVLKQKLVSVPVEKLDTLMNMVGELVVAESLVTRNPEVTNLNIESFSKASRHLRKISSDLQDMVMAIRMMPISSTFNKMHRLVRDMNKELDKDVYLRVKGETTEVDKNIIDKLTDPLMHIIRNAIDHGIESKDERLKLNKTAEGTITLEASHAGGDVLISIEDDGKGLDPEMIYKRAYKQGLTGKSKEDLSHQEIFSYIFEPGFSTKDQVTSYSGRGVGMDVVSKSLETLGGHVTVDSEKDQFTRIMLKIPLTLAIIDGMNLKVGESHFTLPLMDIKESFRPRKEEVFKNPNGQEMIMLRGECYPILRLHSYYNLETDVKSCDKGILIMVETYNNLMCLFADELLGQQQVVVKSLPNYIKKKKQVKGVAGCTLLGDGHISLILDPKVLNESQEVNG
ncbi:chemotaxis protein CheA [Acidaminobacter sp. JC074]|uniref:chemotaxis protein CheA n=1 Tax=Acidaminobacter sp. JC074 TaxID=2530199 RepID=UPI001F102CB1|nr:chemotaxis protein CheA [Acidaminobacter sp. JC074]MCH4890794.1 chemotaxis protein CheA [Acidaminobacter sp. JC074]